jgi:replicative DNA helicase
VVDAVSEIIEPEDFWWPKHQVIFQKMLDLHFNGKLVDVATMSAEGMDSGQLHDLLEKPSVSTRAMDYARQLQALAIRRRVIKAGHQIIDVAAGTTDGDEVIDTAEETVFACRKGKENDAPQKLEEMLFEVECEIAKGAPTFGLRTGIDDINEIIVGMTPGTFNILAARPGQGKTCMALDMARHLSKDQTVLFFSVEMTKKEIAERLIAAEGCVGLTKLRTCTMDEREQRLSEKAMNALRERKLLVDDSSTTMYDIQRKVRRVAARGGLGLVIIDYIQLLDYNKRKAAESRQYEVAQISRAAKLLAREYNIPVIGLSQMSRQEDKYATPKRPTLSTLRDSGALEQDADQVWFLHRPEEGSHECEFIVAKNRSGPVDHTTIHFWPQFTTFRAVGDPPPSDYSGR